MNANRYIRQTILPEVGDAGQRKIAEASVLCVGAGGLSCPALLYLAGAGVGHIGIVDFDEVDESNLQRQILYKQDQVDQNKAQAAKENLLELNEAIKITAFTERLSVENVERLTADFDIILDGSDNFDTKFLVNDAGVKFNKPVVYASILGFEGQVAVFDANRGSCYRCLFPAPPTQNIPNCANSGVIGALAGIVGSIQAMEVIKMIVDHKSFEPLIGKLWTIDARTMTTKMLNLHKELDCPTCSKPKDQIALQSKEKGQSQMIKEISSEEAASKTDAILLDVREQDEWDLGHIEGAIFIPLSKMMSGEKPQLEKNREILIYCRSGVRSMQAAQMLQAEGYSDLTNIKGGILAMSQHMIVVQD